MKNLYKTLTDRENDLTIPVQIHFSDDASSLKGEIIMRVRPFKPCCKKTAIQAFLQDNAYLIGCQFCGTCFSITHDFQFFIEQILASHKIYTNYPLSYDIVPFNGEIIFMIP
jgi:hypothetical protein